ncbi:uncharacterized protein LOC134830121 [Culicoides brevitarsis]|uniref:uncharacterized protein LOC134830121 n=1 Tax=Culicoides brevitarsis TaxID=469753 RepID=UPI00307BDB1F
MDKLKSDSASDASKMNLLGLDDDCLLEILENFDLFQLLNFRGICARFDNLINKCRFKFVNFNSKILSGNSGIDCEIFEFLGPVIKKLSLDRGHFTEEIDNLLLLEKIIKFCENLESLMFLNFDLSSKSVQEKFRKIVEKLKFISFCNCIFKDDFGESFSEATTLKELSIEENHQITSKFFEKLSNLTSLSIVNCSKIKSKSLKMILKKKLTLKKLKICSHKPILDRTSIEFIVTNAENLEELTTTANKIDLLRLVDIPNLKKLSIISVGSKINKVTSLLEKLTKKNSIEDLQIDFLHLLHMQLASKLTNLKKLKFHYWYGFTGDDLERTFSEDDWLSANDFFTMIRFLTKLEQLVVSTHFIDIGFLEKLEIFLMQTGDNRPKIEISFKKVMNNKSDETLYDLLDYLNGIKNFKISGIESPEDIYHVHRYLCYHKNNKIYYAPYYEAGYPENSSENSYISKV